MAGPGSHSIELVETEMTKLTQKFSRDEDGAVTVDWVVLTAAAVGLALGAFAMIDTNARALFQTTAEALEAENVAAGN